MVLVGQQVPRVLSVLVDLEVLKVLVVRLLHLVHSAPVALLVPMVPLDQPDLVLLEVPSHQSDQVTLYMTMQIINKPFKDTHDQSSTVELGILDS